MLIWTHGMQLVSLLGNVKDPLWLTAPTDRSRTRCRLWLFNVKRVVKKTEYWFMHIFIFYFYLFLFLFVYFLSWLVYIFFLFLFIYLFIYIYFFFFFFLSESICGSVLCYLVIGMWLCDWFSLSLSLCLREKKETLLKKKNWIIKKLKYKKIVASILSFFSLSFVMEN